MELEGISMIVLCSKTYIIEDKDDKHKIFYKGVSKCQISNPIENVLNVLKNKGTKLAKIVRYRVMKSQTFIFSQSKVKFNYFYCKRQVLSNGTPTIPLNL